MSIIVSRQVAEVKEGSSQKGHLNLVLAKNVFCTIYVL